MTIPRASFIENMSLVKVFAKHEQDCADDNIEMASECKRLELEERSPRNMPVIGNWMPSNG